MCRADLRAEAACSTISRDAGRVVLLQIGAMRRVLALVVLVACGGSEKPEYPVELKGGSLELAECGYTITTREGAEPPQRAGTEVGPDPTPRLVHLGIVGDPRTSIVAQWRTVDETTRATTLRLAKGADLPASALTETVTGIEFAYESLDAGKHRVHQVHLCGLEPGTAYSYQVGSEGHFSPVYTFHTAPDVTARPDAEVVFAFVGDSRDGYDVWGQLVDLYLERLPDLVLYSGDAVSIGLLQEEWEHFLGRAEPLFAQVPVVISHGNHETNAVNFYSQFAMPGDQENFGFDYGFARITIANDTPSEPSDLTEKIPAFLRADFAASTTARWKLLMHHQPQWSASNHGSNRTLQQTWGPIVDEYGVDLVLNGHEHEIEITKPLRGGEVQASNDDGTVYVVAGGAGAPLYSSGTEYWTEYSEKTYGGALIRVRRDQLVLEAFRADGTPIPAGFSKTKP